MLKAKSAALPIAFEALFGHLPLPGLVHDGDGQRQSRTGDAYTRPEDFSHMQTTHAEFRLALALLVCTAVGKRDESSSSFPQRKQVAAELLRDLIDALLQQLCAVTSAALKFEGLVLLEEAYPVKDGCIAKLTASGNLRAMRGWPQFQAWWEAVVCGETDLPAGVITTPALSSVERLGRQYDKFRVIWHTPVCRGLLLTNLFMYDNREYLP